MTTLRLARRARLLTATARELDTLRRGAVEIDALIGSGEDEGRFYAEPHFCGNRVFRCRRPMQEMLDHYGLSVDEYGSVCDKLESNAPRG